MDVNGSRFHSRLGERDWRPVAASSMPFDMSPGEIQRWLTRGAESPPAVEGFQPVVWSDAWAGVSLAPRIPLLATPAGTTRASRAK